MSNLPENCSLAYYLPHEAHYADRLFRVGALDTTPHMMVFAESRDGGCAWEFQISEKSHYPSTTRIEMFADAYDALKQIPEFFARMIAEKPGTLKEVRAILDSLGAKDTTARGEQS